MSVPSTDVMGADMTHRRVGPGALAMVGDELDRLPRVDNRHRLWPWSRRALAQRRRCSPGTVHKHHQALLAAGILVLDDQGRTLVDTVCLDEVSSAGRRSTSYRHQCGATSQPGVEQSDDCPRSRSMQTPSFSRRSRRSFPRWRLAASWPAC